VTGRILPTTRIAPSKVNLWAGNKVEGSRWTAEQIREMGPIQAAREDIEIKRVRLLEEPTRDHPIPREIFVECPIIRKHPEHGHVVIITPAGIHIRVKA